MGLLDPVYKTINNGIASAGSFAGNTVSGAGQAVSSTGRGVGDSITGQAGRAGDYGKDTGNYIKDATNASGPRIGTASNPLGVNRNQRAAISSGPVYGGPQTRSRTTAGGPATQPSSTPSTRGGMGPRKTSRGGVQSDMQKRAAASRRTAAEGKANATPSGGRGTGTARGATRGTGRGRGATRK